MPCCDSVADCKERGPGRSRQKRDLWRYNKSEVVSLLERFIANPEQTRHALLVRLGILDERAADFFALTVFLCDELLQLDPVLTITNSAAATFRFFNIARRLPMELRMILCHRVVGSRRQNILSEVSEIAFKSLAGNLLSQPK